MRRLLLAGCAVSLLGGAPAPASTTSSDFGTITGRVILRERPPNRLASRYAGAGGSGSHEVAELPAVVYVIGPTGGAAGPRRVELAQRDTAFIPNVLVVSPGTTVDFPNYDPFFHNVFSFSKPKRFDLGRYPRGDRKSVTFDKPGVVKIYCEVHKWMRAAVLVLENPYYAEVAADGSYRIDDVPPGRYRVAVWHMDRGEKVYEVDVSSGGAARLDASL